MSSPHGNNSLNVLILEALFDHESDAIVVFNEKGDVVFHNKAVTQIPELHSLVSNDSKYETIIACVESKAIDADRPALIEAFGKIPAKKKIDIEVRCHGDLAYELHSLPIEQGKKFLGVIWRLADITQVKVSRAELEQQEKKYSQLFTNMINAFALHKVITDKTGKPIDYEYIEVNEVFTRMLQMPSEQIIGKKVTELIPGIEKDSTDWIGVFGEVGMTGKSLQLENYSEALKRWFNITCYSPRKGYFATIFEDITKRKEGEFALAESERKSRAIFDQSFQFMGLLSLDGKLLEVNDTAMAFIGKKREEVIGKYFWDTPWWNFSQEVMDSLKKSIQAAAKGLFVRYETFHKGVDDEIHTIDYTLKAVRDNRGAITYLIAEGRDITERKEMEEHINELKNRSEAILNSIGDAVFAISTTGEIVTFNNAAAEISGILKTDALGKNFRSVVNFISEKTGEKSSDFITEAIEQKKVIIALNKLAIVSKENKIIPVNPTASPVINNEGKTIGCVVIFRDVTEERSIDKAKSEFVMIASHQLRTPLTVMKWSLESLFATDLSPLTKTQKDRLNESYLATNRMSDLVDSLLNASRLDIDTIDIQPERVQLQSFMNSLITEHLQVISQKGLTLTQNYDPTIKSLFVDKKLFGIVIGNLLSNAIKYSKLSGKIFLSFKKQAGKVVFKISDTGIGIPKEQQHKVFEKMFRADNAINLDPSGSGLGLYIAKSIITKGGGDIWFESSENGTTFYISLPESGMKTSSRNK